MSEMVERAAQAILGRSSRDIGMTRVEALDYATAVIDAMREPTDGMLFAAIDGRMMLMSTATDIWQDMIDEALK